MLAEGRARVAAEKIKEVLNKTTDILPGEPHPFPVSCPTPSYIAAPSLHVGVDMTMLWVELGLSADIKRISSEEQVQIYNEYMGKLEQVCVADLTELFLEKSDLFDTISTTSHTKDTFDLVHQELKVCACTCDAHVIHVMHMWSISHVVHVPCDQGLLMRACMFPIFASFHITFHYITHSSVKLSLFREKLPPWIEPL